MHYANIINCMVVSGLGDMLHTRTTFRDYIFTLTIIQLLLESSCRCMYEYIFQRISRSVPNFPGLIYERTTGRYVRVYPLAGNHVASAALQVAARDLVPVNAILPWHYTKLHGKCCMAKQSVYRLLVYVNNYRITVYSQLAKVEKLYLYVYPYLQLVNKLFSYCKNAFQPINCVFMSKPGHCCRAQELRQTLE